MNNCDLCKMKKVFSSDIGFIGQDIFVKEHCPKCNKPLAISIKHKDKWNKKDKDTIILAFYKYLKLGGIIDWESSCFNAGHIHCHFNIVEDTSPYSYPSQPAPIPA